MQNSTPLNLTISMISGEIHTLDALYQGQYEYKQVAEVWEGTA
jgi:hypothetical protein